MLQNLIGSNSLSFNFFIHFRQIPGFRGSSVYKHLQLNNLWEVSSQKGRSVYKQIKYL